MSARSRQDSRRTTSAYVVIIRSKLSSNPRPELNYQSSNPTFGSTTKLQHIRFVLMELSGDQKSAQ